MTDHACLLVVCFVGVSVFCIPAATPTLALQLQVTQDHFCVSGLRAMAGQDSVVPDLTNDNFDLLRFPSLTGFAHELPADNDDLNVMARLGSLFDPSVKATLPSISPLSSTTDAAQPAQQAGQQMPQQMDPAGAHLLHTSPRAQPMPFSANSPGYPMLSPRTSAPNAVQMVPRPPMMVCSLLESLCFSV